MYTGSRRTRAARDAQIAGARGGTHTYTHWRQLDAEEMSVFYKCRIWFLCKKDALRWGSICNALCKQLGTGVCSEWIKIKGMSCQANLLIHAGLEGALTWSPNFFSATFCSLAATSLLALRPADAICCT